MTNNTPQTNANIRHRTLAKLPIITDFLRVARSESVEMEFHRHPFSSNALSASDCPLCRNPRSCQLASHPISYRPTRQLRAISRLTRSKSREVPGEDKTLFDGEKRSSSHRTGINQ